MKTKKLFIFGLALSTLSLFSQSVPAPEEQPEANTPGNPQLQAIVFKYDDAGNQIYRGYAISGKSAPEEEPQVAAQNLMDEDQFWLGIQIYPVPVKDVLSIVWNEENNDLIQNVTLYQHNTVAFLFEQKNYPNLNRQIQINMNSYYTGVYVLNFQLKDGRVMSRNIIKE